MMSRKRLILALAAVVALQISVLAAEFINAVYPLWNGRPILLQTHPVDPRSLFRGNYALLNYDISEIPGDDINQERTPRNGEVVFVKLKRDAGGIYRYHGAGLKKPQQGVFIRGRIKNYSSGNPASKYRVKYGIEAFFAPKEKALALEKRLRKQAFAKIMVAEHGKAALQDVVGKK